MNRLRLVSVTITPQFLVDDGTDLVSIQVQPFTLAAKDWPDVLARFAAAEEALRAEVEQDVAPTT